MRFSRGLTVNRTHNVVTLCMVDTKQIGVRKHMRKRILNTRKTLDPYPISRYAYRTYETVREHDE